MFKNILTTIRTFFKDALTRDHGTVPHRSCLSKLIWSVLRYTMKTLTSRMVWAEIHADSNSDPNVQNTSNCAPM